jgi:signal transduction histidine kinase
LQTALREYLRQWSQQTGIVWEFQVANSPEGMQAPELRPEIEEALFRVAQEALGNVARHSQASQVQVQFKQEPDQVYLRIADNGKGFVVDQAAGRGHGLTNMRDRVETYGGTFRINSGPGETVVTGCISLNQETPPPGKRRKRETA